MVIIGLLIVLIYSRNVVTIDLVVLVAHGILLVLLVLLGVLFLLVPGKFMVVLV